MTNGVKTLFLCSFTPGEVFVKYLKERIFLRSFYEANITLCQNKTEMRQEKKTTDKYYSL